jgi:hypothetical protein
MKYIDRVTGIKRRTQNRAIILSSLGHFSVSPTPGPVFHPSPGKHRIINIMFVLR